MDVDNYILGLEGVEEFFQDQAMKSFYSIARGTFNEDISSTIMSKMPGLFNTGSMDIFTQISNYFVSRLLGKNEKVEAPQSVSNIIDSVINKVDKVRKNENLINLVYGLDTLTVDGLIAKVSALSGNIRVAYETSDFSLLDKVQATLSEYINSDVFNNDFMNNPNYREILPPENSREYQIIKSAHENMGKIKGKIQELLTCSTESKQANTPEMISNSYKDSLKIVGEIQELTHNFKVKSYIGMFMTTQNWEQRASEFIQKHENNILFSEKYSNLKQGNYFRSLQ